LLLLDPAGHRSRIPIQRVPFRMGRQPDCELILRDSRASRNHAQIVLEGGQYILEDAGSRHGVWVNGERVSRRPLRDSDRIEFGFPDSYRVVFISGAAELRELAEHTAAAAISGGPGANLAKLRAILEVARTLQTGFSLNDVLTAVVDAALAITGAERGFLLLRDGDGLDTRVARSRAGARLDPADLRVPRRVIRRALDERRDLFSMNFDPHTLAGVGPEQSIADLELRSCICVPLVRIRTGSPEATSVLDAASQTAGVLYMDSRLAAADLTGGNRELLQSLAIEASTVLENARLLQEERAKQKMEEELQIARGIQQSLLPRVLPSSGWFRAAGSSVPTHEVGGDYFDVVQVSEDRWSAVAADVSGKGVSSALLAALLQGAFLGVAGRIEGMEDRFARMNRFLNERTGGEKYATVFYCALDRGGAMHYINAGHCAPVVVRCSGTLGTLGPTGMPVGLIDSASFEMRTVSLAPGDKVVIYTDGITEAQGPTGEFFGRKRLREEIRSLTAASCAELHAGILRAVTAFTGGAPQSDDLTLVVLEYRLP
jgi:serine phosphatase RsbU (regulator of sigma subunit)